MYKIHLRDTISPTAVDSDNAASSCKLPVLRDNTVSVQHVNTPITHQKIAHPVQELQMEVALFSTVS